MKISLFLMIFIIITTFFIFPISAVVGEDWKLVNASAAFSGRHSHQCVVFDDKMWVIGGYDSSILKNDIWSSVDGDTWTLINSSAEFSARRYHQAVVFDNKMWVIGGYDGVYKNDTWSSTDGNTWTLVNASAVFSGRHSHQCVVFDNKMWVIGGLDGVKKNDTWSSVDGDTWTLVNSSAEFSTRMYHQVITFDNKMWVIGGYDGVKKNDTWSSVDGDTWTLVNASATFSGRHSYQCVVFDNKMWVIGGYDGVYKNDTWSSTDGNTWTLVNASAAFSGRYRHQSIIFNNKMWVIGGLDGVRKNDTWFSEKLPPYIPQIPTNLQNTTGIFWINHTWQAGGGNITDSYNVSVNNVWYNETINAYWNVTYPYSNNSWQNITIWAYNNTVLGNLSTNSISQNTQLFFTNLPTNLQETHDHIGIHWTWGESFFGTHIIDSYNVSINGTWYNGTTNQFYKHTELDYKLTSSIVVYGYNNTQGLSIYYIFDSYTLPTTYKTINAIKKIVTSIQIIADKFFNIIPFIISIILFAGFGLVIIVMTSRLKKW